MDFAKTCYFTIAVFMIVLTLHDVILTVLSHQGAGPITNFWTKRVWRIVRWFKNSCNIDFFYRYAGPAFLLGIIAVWYVLLNLSWLILLYVGDYTVKGQKGETVLELTDYLYFLSSTFTTLGLGDYVPTGFPWTMVVTSGALVMSFLTTLSISYIIPIVSAVVDRRKMISAIDIIGTTPKDIIAMCWEGERAGALDSEILGMSDSIIRESYRSHVYPILSYFNFGDSHSTLNVAMLNLHDAIAVQDLKEIEKQDLDRPKVIYLLRAFDLYIQNLRYKLSEEPDFKCSHQDFIRLLEEIIGKEALRGKKEEIDQHLKRREELLKLVYMEGRIGVSGEGELRHPYYLNLV